MTVAALRFTVLCSGGVTCPPRAPPLDSKWTLFCSVTIDVGNCHDDTAR